MKLPTHRTCEICASTALTEIHPMEMMKGQGGPFKYVYCGGCGTTYQPEKLENYGQFYPSSYYSFKYSEPNSLSQRIRQLKRIARNKYYYFSQGIMGYVLALIKPCPVNHLSNHVKLRRDMSILEVGSGSGELLYEIADMGIRRAIGIDPFIPNAISYSNGAKVLKVRIDGLEEKLGNEQFDLIMFNHSLEHSPTPFDDLATISKFLKKDGEILIRLPVSGSEIANEYGKYWWSLDAPRHIYIFSVQSMNLLAKRCGMHVKRTHFEGTVDDYLASEQHRAGIPLLSDQSYVVTKNFDFFPKDSIRMYETEISNQNKRGTAALAGFVLGF